jgi:transposase-like protein
MSKTRRRFTAEQKAAILRAHLIDQVSVADLCDKHKIQPTLFYRWQKEMLENLPALFERQSGSELKALRRQAEALKAKLVQKDEVIAEIMADFIAAKKTTGGD